MDMNVLHCRSYTLVLNVVPRNPYRQLSIHQCPLSSDYQEESVYGLIKFNEMRLTNLSWSSSSVAPNLIPS